MSVTYTVTDIAKTQKLIEYVPVIDIITGVLSECK
jgi:hypothetical protein